MIDQIARITGIVKGEVKKRALNLPAGYFVGPAFGPVPVQGQAGQMQLGPVWVVTVTMANPLLGQTDIAQSVPIPGVLPPDEAFRVITGKLFESCLAEYDKALGKEIPSGLITS
jgi:hypothetical protein